MKKLFNFRGISGVALSVFLIIILLLSIYFFVRINRNENNLRQRGFNVLNQLNGAIAEKDRTLERVAQNLKINYRIKNIHQRIKTISRNNKVLASRGIGFSDKKDNIEAISYELRKREKRKKRERGIFMNIGFDDFLNPLLRTDFLSHYVLIEKGGGADEKSNLLKYSSFPFGIELAKSDIRNMINKLSNIPPAINKTAKQDSLASSIFQSGIIRKVNIQGVEYEMFLIPAKIGENQYYLGGFIEGGTYMEMKRGLDSTTIFIFILILVVTLFSLPILKILLIGPLEKLSRTTITMTGISVIVEVVIVVVLVTISYILLRSKNDIQFNLEQLNQNITRSFTDESKALLKQMVDYDELLAKIPKSVNNAALKDDSTCRPKQINYFKNFFWVDSTGMQIAQISTRKDTSGLTNLAFRDYVKNYRKWRWKNFDGQQEERWYTVEPIYSNVTGEWLLAYSTQSDKMCRVGEEKGHKAKLMAVTSNMYSLQDAILPDGYEFCLVDNKAKVWYHSGDQLYMNEDFIKACGDNQRLAAAINSGINDNFAVKLHSKTYYVSVKAVENTQLYMITMCDPLSIRVLSAQASFFLFVSLALVFVLLMILHLGSKLILYRESNLIGKKYFFNWLIPNNVYQREYTALFVGNVLVSAALLLYSITGHFKSLSPDTVVLLMVSIIAANFFLSFIRLQKKNQGGNNLQKHKQGVWGKVFYGAPLLLVLLVIDIVAYRLNGFGSSLLPIALSQVAVLAAYVVFFFLFTRGLVRFIKLKLNTYILFIYSWLVLCAVIPSFLILKKTFEFEFRTYIANQQISLAQQINKRTERIHDFYANNIPVHSMQIIEERLDKGNYFTFFQQTKDLVMDSSGTSGDHKPDTSKFLAFNRIFHYYYNSLLGGKNLLEVNQQEIDSSVYHAKDASLVLKFSKFGYDSLKNRKVTRKGLGSKTNYVNFNPLENIFHSMAYWLTLLIFLLLIFLLLKILIRRLFDFNSLNFEPITFGECVAQLCKAKISGVIVDINQHDPANCALENHHNLNLAVENFKIPDLKPEGRLVVTGLDNVEDLKAMDTWLKRLEQLRDKYSNRLTIMLCTSPNLLVEMHARAAKKGNDKEEASQGQNLVYQLNKAFANLPVLYAKSVQKKDSAKNNNDLEQFVQNELGFDSYTEKLRPIVEFYIDKEKLNNKEMLTIKIQELALSHYIFIWNNLSLKEKFVLYDLAQDSVANLKNKDVLNSLLGKGILKRTSEILFTSLSFKNFILTIADKTEIEKEQDKISFRGNWNKLRSPLIIIVASIIVFLFATQMSFLSNIYTILISLGTLLGVFIKFSGMFK